jgi:hypothetical protein
VRGEVGEVEREVAGAVAVRACVQRVQEAAVRLGTKEMGARGGALAGWAGAWPGRSGRPRGKRERRGRGWPAGPFGRPSWVGLSFFFFLFFCTIAFSHLKMYLRHQNKSKKCK